MADQDRQQWQSSPSSFEYTTHFVSSVRSKDYRRVPSQAIHHHSHGDRSKLCDRESIKVLISYRAQGRRLLYGITSLDETRNGESACVTDRPLVTVVPVKPLVAREIPSAQLPCLQRPNSLDNTVENPGRTIVWKMRGRKGNINTRGNIATEGHVATTKKQKWEVRPEEWDLVRLLALVTRPAVASFPGCHLQVSAPGPPATEGHPCLYPRD